MIDFHSHIIFEVDDGSQSIEESIRLVKEAKRAGFNAIIATPHYMEDYYMCNYNQIEEKIQMLESQINRMERQLRRLDNRVNNIENSLITPYSSQNTGYGSANNKYMM